MKTSHEINEIQSERIFWVIQTVFGFILARSFYTYGTAFLPPIQGGVFTLTLALVAVYGCVLWSWIDFSYTLVISPYNFGKKPLERYRFVSDLFVVLVYTYLLLYIKVINDNPACDLSAFIFAFALVYFGYAISGTLRIIEYGKRASRLGLILTFFVIFFCVAFFYYQASTGQNNQPVLNRLFLVLTILLNGLYRTVRVRLATRKTLIGIDVDGVLSNQIEDLLPIIRERYNSKITYADVTDWRLPIGDTSIDKLIVEEQKQRPFIINMPMHPGAAHVVSSIIKKHRVAIATARSSESDEWTRHWLNKNDIPFDDYYNLREGGKQNAQETFDILVDDYEGNIIAFLNGHPDKSAILFSQPWNVDRQNLEVYRSQKRLEVVDSWKDMPRAIKKLLV